MSHYKPSVSPDDHALSPLSNQKKTLDDLCLWIDLHLGEPLGWQQLLTQSGLDYQTIQALFCAYKNATPMDWVRSRRAAESESSPLKKARRVLSLPELKSH